MPTPRPQTRWRGRMPFRQNRRNEYWSEPLEQQGRTGEPSLAQRFAAAIARAGRYAEAGQGKAHGSFTAEARRALRTWQRDQGIGPYDPVTFTYRLYRHRTVQVTLTGARICHWPAWGAGSKGFVLVGNVLAIDGLQARPNHVFALTRIVGHERLVPVPLLR